MASTDSTTRKSQDVSTRRPVSHIHPPCLYSIDPNIVQQSDTTKFSKITEMKRGPTNDNAAARRASFEEQTIPRGAGVLGDMWNK